MKAPQRPSDGPPDPRTLPLAPAADRGGDSPTMVADPVKPSGGGKGRGPLKKLPPAEALAGPAHSRRDHSRRHDRPVRDPHSVGSLHIGHQRRRRPEPRRHRRFVPRWRPERRPVRFGLGLPGPTATAGPSSRGGSGSGGGGTGGNAPHGLYGRGRPVRLPDGGQHRGAGRGRADRGQRRPAHEHPRQGVRRPGRTRVCPGRGGQRHAAPVEGERAGPATTSW